MLEVLRASWALMLGFFMLQIGNGLLATLTGIRGGIEGFSTTELSIIMSGYFVGFLGGSRFAPEMIRRVGHVRVFAALGSVLSAVVILFPAFVDPYVWTFGRVVVGFAMSGLYVTAESWLNDAATNETRGKALSLYIIMQMGGIVLAQYLLVTADAGGFLLFIMGSVLVSLSFAPILLSVSPTPAFQTAKPMRLIDLYRFSPLAVVGMTIIGLAMSVMFSMPSVYGSVTGLSVGQISGFVSSFFIGALVLQYPIGWISDRSDRRSIILFMSAFGAAGSVAGALFGGTAYPILLAAAFFIGGTINPLYSLLIAYMNDYLEHDDMAAASGGLVFVSGVGAIGGPLAAGWVMEQVGGAGYFWFLGSLLLSLTIYAGWRMTRRPVGAATPSENTSYAPVPVTASPVAAELAQEVYIESELDEQRT